MGAPIMRPDQPMVRNLACLLPDGHIPVTYWAKHPCDDDLYMVEAWIWGASGRVGYWLPWKEPE